MPALKRAACAGFQSRRVTVFRPARSEGVVNMKAITTSRPRLDPRHVDAAVRLAVAELRGRRRERVYVRVGLELVKIPRGDRVLHAGPVSVVRVRREALDAAFRK